MNTVCGGGRQEGQNQVQERRQCPQAGLEEQERTAGRWGLWVNLFSFIRVLLWHFRGADGFNCIKYIGNQLQ